MKIALITDSYASMDTDVAVHVGVLAEGLLRMGHRVLIKSDRSHVVLWAKEL